MKTTHDLCVSPPVSAYLNQLSAYQIELRNAIQFISTLNGKLFEGKKIKVSVKTEPSLTEMELTRGVNYGQTLFTKGIKFY